MGHDIGGVASYLGDTKIAAAAEAEWQVRRTCFHCRHSDWLDLSAIEAGGSGRTFLQLMESGAIACPNCQSNDIFVGTNAAPLTGEGEGELSGSYIWQNPNDPIELEEGRVLLHSDDKLTHFPYKIEPARDRKPYVDLVDDPREIAALPEVTSLKMASSLFGGRNRLKALLSDINGDGCLRTTGCAWMFRKPGVSGLWCCGGYIGICRREWERNTSDEMRSLGQRMLTVSDSVHPLSKVVLQIHPIQYRLQPYFALKISSFCFDKSKKGAFLKWDAQMEVIRRALLAASQA